jgi:enoyl-CoA hydratase/carnithine racemase
MIPLVRLIPPRAAMEMLLTGAPISARRAMELGLVNHVVRAKDLDAVIDALTAAIMSMSPRVIGLGKRAFYELNELTEAAAYERAVDIMVENAAYADAHEGISAFLEKRPARWKG